MENAPTSPREKVIARALYPTKRLLTPTAVREKAAPVILDRRALETKASAERVCKPVLPPVSGDPVLERPIPLCRKRKNAPIATAKTTIAMDRSMKAAVPVWAALPLNATTAPRPPLE